MVTPPSSYLVSSTGNSQNIVPYTLDTRELARGGVSVGGLGLPVAYHIQVNTPGALNCNTGITVYPSKYTRILAPSAVDGLKIVSTGGLIEWNPLSVNNKYIFVNKDINIGESGYIYGTAPQGGSGVLTNIPIRKRAFV